MRSNEFEKIADLLARQYKVIVREGEGWAANIKEKKVFYKKKDIYSLSEDHILGLLLHEIAHIHYTTDIAMPQINPELIHSCLNMIEDISIEHIIGGDYPNAGEILESTKQEILDTLVKILPKMENTSLHEKAMLYASAKFSGRGDKTPKEDYAILGNEIAKIMINKKNEILERKQTKDLLPLVKEIVNMLLAKFGQPTPEEKRRMMADARGQLLAQDGLSQGGNARNKIAKTLGGRGWKGSAFDGATNVLFIDKIADKANIIGKQLRSVLKRNNAMEFGGRYRTGKLMTKRLNRIKITKDRKPFGRRIIKSNQSYAFAIASDVSGSMFGGGSVQQADYALSSMYMVAEALRLAGIPRSLTVFGTRAALVNKINKLAIRWSDLASKEILKRAGNSNTNIHEAMKMEREQLHSIRAERKILIILTDGQSDRERMKEEYEKAQKEGIECIAIGIGGGSYYLEEIFTKTNFKDIDDTRDNGAIGKTFIDILKTTIAKSP
jgi:hypothetical protein